MTGFGSASSREAGISLQVEIRSVNNKFYKSHIRLPEQLQSLEQEIDSYISQNIVRGSITVSVKFVDNSEKGIATINVEVLNNYISQLREVDQSAQIDLSRLLNLQGVLTNDSEEEIAQRVKPSLIKLLTESCESLLEMRAREGKSLSEDLCSQLSKIGEHLDFIKERAPKIVSDYQNRLRQRMESLLAEVGKGVEESDLLREVAIFAEKTDIAEEISRLSGHLDQFNEFIDDSTGEPIGRTLDFLEQERKKKKKKKYIYIEREI